VTRRTALFHNIAAETRLIVHAKEAANATDHAPDCAPVLGALARAAFDALGVYSKASCTELTPSIIFSRSIRTGSVVEM
jgi:hypothetical protein